MRLAFIAVRPPSTLRVVTAAVVPPAVATGVAAIFHPAGTGLPVALLLFAVVVAAAVGGPRSGLTAAAASSLSFIYFFTEPRFSLRIVRAQEVLTSVVLVIVAVLVGALFARTVEEAQRAAKRERQASFLGRLTSRLLSGGSLERILDELATSLLEELDLAGCEIVADLGGREHVAHAVHPRDRPASPEPIAIELGGEILGRIEAAPPLEGSPLSSDRRELLTAVAAQVGVALERARLDDAVRAARVEAEANELRAALFSSVTHDLRTPLASIKAGISSLRTEAEVLDAARREELLATVAEETDRLDRLVGNIVDLARARSGGLVLEREKIGVDEVLDALLTRLRPRLAGVQVETIVRPDLPDLSADPVQIDQALTNVLENAIGHSPPGGEIRISAARFGSMVELRVMDHGPGIPPEERDRVFEAFYRRDADRVRPGSGLGLAIARAVVVSHGGRIRIEGTPGGGTTVVIELPSWRADVA